MSKRRSRRPRRIFIETSVFIRFLTRDDSKKAADCERLFELVEAGEMRPCISNIVVLEIVYVLQKLYGFSRTDVARAVEKVIELRNLVLVEKTNTRGALAHWKERSAKYGDCLIASQVPRGVPIITYDADFQAFPELNVLSPADIA